MKTPILTTKRLILRPVTLEDAAAVQPLFNDWDVLKYMTAGTVPWPYPDDGVHSYYKNNLLPNMEKGKKFGWLITEKNHNIIMGLLTLAPFDEEDNRGFWLGKTFHGKGYISEAVTVTTDYAFGPLGMQRLLLNNAKENIASRNIKVKQNATLERTEKSLFVCGECEKEFWRLTPDAWAVSPMKRQYG